MGAEDERGGIVEGESAGCLQYMAAVVLVPVDVAKRRVS